MRPDRMRNPVYISGESNQDHIGEDGYLLIAVLFLVAMILMTLAVAAPRVATELQRDKETELFHRGMQYAGAVRRYYKRFGSYPSSLEQLDKTSQLRFLRRRYKDPVTGKAEWRLIRYGQAKTLGTGTTGSSTGTTSSTTSSTLTTSTFGTSSGSSGSSGSSLGDSGTTSSASGTSTATSGTDTSSSTTGSSSTAGTSTIGGSSSTVGGQIIGVSSTSPKQSIREFKKQKHYNEWEFVYDPNQENKTAGSTGTGVSTSTASGSSTTSTGTSSTSTTNQSSTTTQ